MSYHAQTGTFVDASFLLVALPIKVRILGFVGFIEIYI